MRYDRPLPVPLRPDLDTRARRPMPSIVRGPASLLPCDKFFGPMRDDPFPREPRTFLKFYPKTKADLAKHVAAMQHIHAASGGDDAVMRSDELLMMCRDIQRAIDMFDLAEFVMRDLGGDGGEEQEEGAQP